MSAPIREFERGLFVVKVVHVDDPAGGETGYLGSFCAEPSAWPAWDRALKRVLWRRQDYHRAKDAKVASRWDNREYRYVHDFPDVRGVSKREATKYILQNVSRLETYGAEWTFVGIVAKAYRFGIKLGQAACFGIESDADTVHFADITEELVGQATYEASANLARLIEAGK